MRWMSHLDREPRLESIGLRWRYRRGPSMTTTETTKLPLDGFRVRTFRLSDRVQGQVRERCATISIHSRKSRNQLLAFFLLAIFSCTSLLLLMPTSLAKLGWESLIVSGCAMLLLANYYLWTTFGMEIVSVTDDSLIYMRGVLPEHSPLGPVRQTTYGFGEISDIVIQTGPKYERLSRLGAWIGGRFPNAVVFSYREKRHGFGIALDQQEAEELAGLLRMCVDKYLAINPRPKGPFRARSRDSLNVVR